MDGANHSQIMVVLAKSMPLVEILSALTKNSEILNRAIKDGKVKPTVESMKSNRAFNEVMTHTQLFITKMAYEETDMLEALKQVDEYKKEFDIKREVDDLRKGNGN